MSDIFNMLAHAADLSYVRKRLILYGRIQFAYTGNVNLLHLLSSLLYVFRKLPIYIDKELINNSDKISECKEIFNPIE